MIDHLKDISLVFVCFVINAVSGGYKCHDYSNISPAITSNTGSSLASKECCKAEHGDNSLTVTHFHCDTGCCGERDEQYCCAAVSNDSDRMSYVIGGSIAGVFACFGIVALLVWIYRKSCRAEVECSDHKKLIKEVYSAERLEELFVPSQSLMSAPGTIVHPLTNVNGPFYTMDATAYVMPDLRQSGLLPQLPPEQPVVPGNNNDDDNEENWDTWDGFPASADHVGVSALAGANSVGQGRDNPYYEGDREEGAEGGGGLPYYYEQYDKYSQPPPGYEEVTK